MDISNARMSDALRKLLLSVDNLNGSRFLAANVSLHASTVDGQAVPELFITIIPADACYKRLNAGIRGPVHNGVAEAWPENFKTKHKDTGTWMLHDFKLRLSDTTFTPQMVAAVDQMIFGLFYRVRNIKEV